MLNSNVLESVSVNLAKHIRLYAQKLEISLQFSPWYGTNLPISLTVEVLPHVSRHTSRHDTSCITGGTIIPALLCCHCVVIMKHGATLAAGGGEGGRGGEAL
jgi:hypothetical protein